MSEGKNADLVPLTFITKFDWNVQVCNKSADLTDLAFGETGRNSAPRAGALGDADRSEFLPHLSMVVSIFSKFILTRRKKI